MGSWEEREERRELLLTKMAKIEEEHRQEYIDIIGKAYEARFPHALVIDKATAAEVAINALKRAGIVFARINAKRDE